MKQYLAQLQEWFNGLAPRERLMVGAGAIFTVFALLYLGVWEPLANAHHQQAENLAASQALAQRLEAISAEVSKSRSSSNSGAAVNRSLSLLSAVDQAGKSGSLSKPPTRLQPEGDNEVKVWIEDTSFDGVLRWIAELESRYGVAAQTVDLEKESAPGLVNARLSLIRP